MLKSFGSSRIAIGPLMLGTLAKGAIRELTRVEVAALKCVSGGYGSEEI
jgi:16S rRNA U516 pseudouridylate synthase RsuA-like enzyme